MNFYSKEDNFLLPRYWFGGVDSRALSVFRIVFALLLLKVALYLLPNARWFYSDEGITPRSALFDGLARDNRFSLMDAISAPWMAQVFFLLWAAVLIGLLVGYRTRLMTVLNFIFLLSIHERNLYVIDGADNVMRVVSFWCMFIPLGKHYSLDVLLRRLNTYRLTQNPIDLRVPAEPRLTFAFPVRMLQIQVALIYLFTFILKLPGDPWKKGEAVYYTLQLQSLTQATGDWVLKNAPFWTLQGMNYFTLVMESSFIFLVFLPFLQPYLRILGLTMGFMLHLGIGLLMSIPNFSSLMPATYLIFFAPTWIQAADDWLRSRRQHLLIPLPKPKSPLWLLLAVTKAEEIEFVTEVTTERWWFADEQNRTYRANEAAWQQIVGHLPLSRLWGWVLRFEWVRGGLWGGLSWLMPTMPMPVRFHESAGQPTRLSVYRRALRYQRVATALVLAGMMILVIRWNLQAVENNDQPIVKDLEGTPRAVIQYLGMWQAWNMFSPYPTTTDGWIQIPGSFEDGTTFDLLTTAPVSDTMRRYYWGPDMRWKKYAENVNRYGYEQLLSAWGSYYCNLYNTQYALPEGQRLATLEIHYVWRRSHAPDEPPNAWQTHIMWRHWCYEKYRY